MLCIVAMYVGKVEAQLHESSKIFLSQTLNQKELGEQELLGDLSKYDYSDIWLQRNDAILGFIGSDTYQRLRIKFLSIIKSAEDSTMYYVYGKSKVKSNVCQFMGKIKLRHIRLVNNPDKQSQYDIAKMERKEDPNRFLQPAYVLVAYYHLFEDPKQKGSGHFEGILKTNFYTYKNTIAYNDIWFESDGYANNQYVGVWISYTTGVSKQCNWGEYRISYSGDLDYGVAFFSPQPQYRAYGWESYVKMLHGDETAKEEEERKWWQ
jgi:hypothetical protein